MALMPKPNAMNPRIKPIGSITYTGVTNMAANKTPADAIPKMVEATALFSISGWTGMESMRTVVQGFK
jgi:hypothetical protein